MIRYDNGDFYMKKVRFRIPNNFLINCDPECTGDYFMELRPPENNYILRVRIIEGCKSTFCEIANYLTDDAGGIPITPPTTIYVGGMSGHQVAVAGEKVLPGQYYAHLTMPDNPTENFIYYIEVKDKATLLPILNSPEIQWFVSNIQYAKD